MKELQGAGILLLQGVDTSSAWNQIDLVVLSCVLGDFWIKQGARLFLPVEATCAVRFAHKSTLQNSNPLGYCCQTPEQEEWGWTGTWWEGSTWCRQGCISQKYIL